MNGKVNKPGSKKPKKKNSDGETEESEDCDSAEDCEDDPEDEEKKKCCSKDEEDEDHRKIIVSTTNKGRKGYLPKKIRTSGDRISDNSSPGGHTTLSDSGASPVPQRRHRYVIT